MTNEERLNRIGDLLRLTILPRTKRPDHLDDATARAELADMVSDLNHEWPAMSEERFAEVSAELARQVRLAQVGRTWPTIALLVKSLKSALTTSRPASAPGGEEPAVIYEAVRDWWDKFRKPGPGSLPKRQHAQRLVDDGLATWSELFLAGFDLPAAGMDEARANFRGDQTAPVLRAVTVARRAPDAGRTDDVA